MQHILIWIAEKLLDPLLWLLGPAIRRVFRLDLGLGRPDLVQLMCEQLKNARDGEEVRVITHTVGPAKDASGAERDQWNEYYRLFQEKKRLNIRIVCPALYDQYRIENLETRHAAGGHVTIRVSGAAAVTHPYTRMQILRNDDIVINTQDDARSPSTGAIRLKHAHVGQVLVAYFDDLFADSQKYEEFLAQYVLQLIPGICRLKHRDRVTPKDVSEQTGDALSEERTKEIIDWLRGNDKLQGNDDGEYWLPK